MSHGRYVITRIAGLLQHRPAVQKAWCVKYTETLNATKNCRFTESGSLTGAHKKRRSSVSNMLRSVQQRLKLRNPENNRGKFFPIWLVFT